LVLIDPRAGTDLGDNLETWGVDVGDDVVLDPTRAGFGQWAIRPLAAAYGDHPITRHLGDTTTFHVARSVMPADDAKGAFSPIVLTDRDSWAERHIERLYAMGRAEYDRVLELKGPVPIAVAGTVRLPPLRLNSARLVVIGDSDFASNQLIGEFGNRDLFVNSVLWLFGDTLAD
jgi:ABC-type uncharacterized transport system involved in gliding motility auxiliary subunit